MKEYISKEEALNFEIEIESDINEIEKIIKGMSIYSEYLKNLETVEIPEWISIKDKLPNNSTYVLVCVNYENFLFNDVDIYYKETNEFLNNKNNVTHWMKLPDLPNSK